MWQFRMLISFTCLPCVHIWGPPRGSFRIISNNCLWNPIWQTEIPLNKFRCEISPRKYNFFYEGSWSWNEGKIAFCWYDLTDLDRLQTFYLPCLIPVCHVSFFFLSIIETVLWLWHYFNHITKTIWLFYTCYNFIWCYWTIS